MALNAAGVFTAAKGYIFTNAVDAAPPSEDAIFEFTGTITTPAGWEVVGHTSRDDLPEFGFDGGDTETRGTWQNEALRTVVTEAAVDFVTFNLVQFDAETLELYYGQANTATGASYGLAGSPGGATEASLLIVIMDGANKIAFYAPKVELRRNDAISIAVDEFGALPMRATFLKSETPDTDLFRWIPGVSTP